MQIYFYRRYFKNLVIINSNKIIQFFFIIQVEYFSRNMHLYGFFRFKNLSLILIRQSIRIYYNSNKEI